jgi:hypothetical protein
LLHNVSEWPASETAAGILRLIPIFSASGQDEGAGPVQTNRVAENTTDFVGREF